MIKKIYTTRGQTILVDDRFYDDLINYKWWYHSRGYAITRFKMGHKRVGERIYLHRLILEMTGMIIPRGEYIDHINQNKLDNRLENLRLVTHQQNLWNSKNRKNKTSKYRGVSWSSDPGRAKRWIVKVNHNGKQRTIGYFSTEDEAAVAYKRFILSLPERRQFLHSGYFRQY